MTDLLKDFQRSISLAEDWAGTMPAKQAVKLRPSDWHDVVRLGRAVAKQLETAQKVDEQQTADFIEQRAAISRLGYQIEEFVGCLEEYVAMPASSLLTRLIGSASDATRVLAEIRGPSKPSEN